MARIFRTGHDSRRVGDYFGCRENGTRLRFAIYLSTVAANHRRNTSSRRYAGHWPTCSNQSVRTRFVSSRIIRVERKSKVLFRSLFRKEDSVLLPGWCVNSQQVFLEKGLFPLAFCSSKEAIVEVLVILKVLLFFFLFVSRFGGNDARHSASLTLGILRSKLTCVITVKIIFITKSFIRYLI